LGVYDYTVTKKVVGVFVSFSCAFIDTGPFQKIDIAVAHAAGTAAETTALSLVRLATYSPGGKGIQGSL
jgi:hypothetical protein